MESRSITLKNSELRRPCRDAVRGWYIVITSILVGYYNLIASA
jgi:hypothetical protein